MALQVHFETSVAANDDPAATELGELLGFHRIGGDAAVMLPDAVTAWVRGAGNGTSIVYAVGHLPTWSKGPSAMRELCARGFVNLTCKRDVAPKQYIAQRTSKPWIEAAQAAPARRTARPVPCYAAHLAELMMLIAEWSAAETPMPTNSEIAGLLGLDRGVQVAYLLGVLDKANQIRRRTIDGPPHRIITVVKTGLSTGTYGGVA
ncbi:hypothetical protein WP12_16945 [Sphingomonas sp. SRS2]|nr:hypothetical protein WP12_16945 [Sphingomonas sp. SRS2]